MRFKLKQVNTKLLAVLILSFAPSVFSEDFKTVHGKEYKDATITRVEPDGIVVKTKSGITKVYFAELPKEAQDRFHYDPQKASEYSAEQAANYGAYQKQQEDARREREDAAAKNNAILAKQEEAKNRTQTLQARYDELQKQEDDLLRQIGEAKQPGPAYYGGKNNRSAPSSEPAKIPVAASPESSERRS